MAVADEADKADGAADSDSGVQVYANIFSELFYLDIEVWIYHSWVFFV